MILFKVYGPYAIVNKVRSVEKDFFRQIKSSSSTV